MANFLLTERAVLITLLGLYITYVSYQGYTMSMKAEEDKPYSKMYISLGILGLIMILYSIYLFYSS